MEQSDGPAPPERSHASGEGGSVHDQDSEDRAFLDSLDDAKRYWLDRRGQGSFREVDLSTLHENVQNLEVHEVSSSEALLGKPSETSMRAVRVLRSNLGRMCPNILRKYGLKADATDNLRLKFIRSRTDNDAEVTSYIAVSYKWLQPGPRSSPDSSPSSTPSSHVIKFPFSDVFIQALLDERKSAQEGLWIDQICINQDDEEEKKITIPAMDLIYRNARIVVIILGDIEVDTQEQETLNEYIKDYEGTTASDRLSQSTEFMKQYWKRPRFMSFWHKLMGAEWFTRGWCTHEFHASERHVFLARCSSLSGRSLLRFTGPFLERLSHPDFEELDRTNRTESWIAQQTGAYLSRRSLIGSTRPDPSSGIESWLATWLIITSRQASGNPSIKDKNEKRRDAIRDLYYICLNTVECGLSYQGDPLLDEQVYGEFICLALAAGDPMALCTSGPQVFIDGVPTWLHTPEDSDIYSDTFRENAVMAHDLHKNKDPVADHLAMPMTMKPFRSDPIVIRDCEHFEYIKLSLYILPRSACVEADAFASDSLFDPSHAADAARWFIDSCRSSRIECPETKMMEKIRNLAAGSASGPSQGENQIIDFFGLESMERLYIETLTNCLLCGMEWIQNAFIPIHDANINKNELSTAYFTIFSHLSVHGSAECSIY